MLFTTSFSTFRALLALPLLAPLAACTVVAPGPGGATPPFTVHSPDMADGRVARAQFASAMGGPGDNLSPQIEWQGAPANAQSFIVTMYDPDAPTGSGWWHWAVANIPATASALPRGAGLAGTSALPPGAVEINTDMGVPGYGGPLPPPGETHRYVVTVTALDVPRLDLPPTATPALLAFMAGAHTVGKASFTAMGAR
ncbi:Raf kinase inhibitor-like protein, YbhB/YbcL family [Acidovorax sp. CF316]|uniref:YbhB/YbcL family Raf kinase inhibitor-like protein n=1 Tax=Acidovorax sp. CF316 TaxID=1144317 RepID=UPI00026BE183|nr:YbhB/YbcL family Raf kinase inhibitor-like protein [Acidovorax sp. CF316]EJE54912.1 Raf kinase inhibitor-like protein, YbhB/YbcL family [Acidovorax sp. CF316]